VKEWLGTVARLVTGGVWIWAALLKLPHLDHLDPDLTDDDQHSGV
jgi:hypothetical protein